MAKKMFVYLLFLSMIITIVSFPVNAEETDMPSLSTEKLTEDTTSSTSNSTNLLENMKQSVNETDKTDISNEEDSTDNIFGVSTNDLLKMMDSTLNGKSDLSLSDAINSLSQSQGTGLQIDTKIYFLTYQYLTYLWEILIQILILVI